MSVTETGLCLQNKEKKSSTQWLHKDAQLGYNKYQNHNRTRKGLQKNKTGKKMQNQIKEANLNELDMRETNK